MMNWKALFTLLVMVVVAWSAMQPAEREQSYGSVQSVEASQSQQQQIVEAIAKLIEDQATVREEQNAILERSLLGEIARFHSEQDEMIEQKISTRLVAFEQEQADGLEARISETKSDWDRIEELANRDDDLQRQIDELKSQMAELRSVSTRSTSGGSNGGVSVNNGSSGGTMSFSPRVESYQIIEHPATVSQVYEAPATVSRSVTRSVERSPVVQQPIVRQQETVVECADGSCSLERTSTTRSSSLNQMLRTRPRVFGR